MTRNPCKFVKVLYTKSFQKDEISPQMHTRVLNVGSSVLRSALLLFLVSFAFETQARAYTDPGTGALIWQMLAAGFVGFAFYFRRLRNWISGRRNGGRPSAREDTGDQISDISK